MLKTRKRKEGSCRTRRGGDGNDKTKKPSHFNKIYWSSSERSESLSSKSSCFFS
jgi:hypothetical protein